MRAAIALLAMSSTASAEMAHPEELVLGELGALEEAAELQVTAMPARTRSGWETRGGIEYGITNRLQIAVEGAWLENAESEIEFGAMVAPIRRDHVALALGGSVSAEGELEPCVAAIVGGRRFGANLAVTAPDLEEIEASFAVFARFS